MVFSPRQRKLRLISIILFLLIIILLGIGWRFIHPERGRLYILFWGGCIILSSILILVALGEMREIARYYMEQRHEIIHKRLGKDGKRKR